MIGYVRVSTVGQAKDGLGIPTQQRLLRDWAKREGHRLVRIVTENGKSGTLLDTERPGLLEALTAVRSGEAAGLAVTSLDRLARALTVQEAVLAKLWQHGGEAFTVDQGQLLRDDPDDPMRTALRQIVGVFAELDRRMTVKRLRNGKLTKAAAGGYAQGAPPFGWRAEGGDLVEDATEQGVLDLMRSWRADGMSLREVARMLNEAGVPPRRGREWYPATVARILARGEQ